MNSELTSSDEELAFTSVQNVMTAIKHTLQRDVFLPSDERLIGLVSVTKAGKKKKTSFLCATVSTDRPVQCRVYQVKKQEKGELYKKKLSWLLRELKVVDGKNAEKDTAEFDLHFEKIYKWVASSVSDKESFIACIWRLSQRYMIQKPEFTNVPQYLMEDVSSSSHGQTVQAGDDMSLVEEDYQALSSKEESDFELLMSECQAAIGNAEVFSEQLSKQLSVLDGANIHSIMGSEDQVLNLMRLLDEGIQEATRIENSLDSYDQILQNVKDQMEAMKDKDTLMTIRNNNHQMLLKELDKLVSQLDLDHKHTKALVDGELSNPNGIYECTAAAYALQRCLNLDIHPALMKMTAVEDQQRRFNRYAASFAKRLAHYLNNLFIHQGNEMGETLSRHAGDLRLPQHNSSHRDLTPYADLMFWLKNFDPKSFFDLSKVYEQSLSKLYSREVADFIEIAKQKLHVGKGDKGKLNLSTNPSQISTSSTSLGKLGKSRGRSASMQSVDSGSLYHGSDSDLAMRHFFDQVFDKVLCELEPVCLAEQDFCVKFFHLMDVQMDSSDQSIEEDGVDVWMLRKPQHQPEDYFMENLGEGLFQKRTTSTARQINEEARKMMKELFPALENDLSGFITYADKLDGFNSMYMLVRMSQHVINTQDMGSFLSMAFANCLVNVKRNFDRFIEAQIQAIQESKVSKKTRCGVINFVHNFEDFANQAESIFKGSERRTDLDKAYTKLIIVIVQEIQRVAVEHPKTPKEVVMMENFHHMYSMLSKVKIQCLESERKEFKQVYVDNMQAYTTNLLGRPLEKLHTFFEGVENRVASGIKPEEVGFQMAYSKQELRKVIKEYPAKEVKKGIEHLYKKVEKQLSEEENLLQVVWHSMQDEFIKQYNHYQELIDRCYPDSMISLDFSINNVLQYFSDIAQSH